MVRICIRIACGSETVEKRSKNGQSRAFARCLTYVGQSLCTQVKPRVCRSIPTYVETQEYTCILKTKAAYA